MADYSDSTRSYRYSYSGSDARAYAYFEGRGDLVVPIESLHTISWSVHEATGQARALGFRSVKGFSKGVRVVAGSLITTVIEDHPLAALMDVLSGIANDPNLRWPSWSADMEMVGVGSGIDNTTFSRRLAPTLPPVNIFVQYVAEGSNWVRDTVETVNIPGAAVLLKGVTFIDEGLVTSTSDSASEMTYSFMALDCKTISKQQFQAGFNPFAPTDDILIKSEMLRQALVKDYRTQEQIYKQQTNQLFGPDSLGQDPFQTIV